MKVIDKKKIQMPAENGWYVCKYASSFVMKYEDKEKKLGRYDVCDCSPILLYWESDRWLKNPNGYEAVNNEDILEWRKLPNDFYIPGERIKLVH